MSRTIKITERFLKHYRSSINNHRWMLATLLFFASLIFTFEGIGIVILIVLFSIHSIYYAPSLALLLILTVLENILEKVISDLGD